MEDLLSKLKELENSLNLFKESNTEKMTGLEALCRKNSERIAELDLKISLLNGDGEKQQQVSYYDTIKLRENLYLFLEIHFRNLFIYFWIFLGRGKH